jgi:predicted enzyme related to lactoylglutathione lyase
MMPRVVHFEISADKPDRAVEFYKNVFGWNVQKWDGPQPYWLVSTGPDGQPGINGGIMNRMGPQPIVNTVDVPSVDEFLSKITAAGGKAVTPKMPIPGVGWMAYCQDTEGNQFGIMQNDPSAK